MANEIPRRGFLQRAGAVAAAGFLPSAQASAQTPVRIGIVGVGNRGTSLLKNLLDLPGVEVTALCDINEEVGQRLAEDSGADFFTGDFETLLKRPEVTAAIIATDENFHVEPTLLAVEQGHVLFIEKPLATMFVWAPIPEPLQAMGSLEFSKALLEQANVAVSPGIGFGRSGEGYVRFALVENTHRVRQAVRNIRRYLRHA